MKRTFLSALMAGLGAVLISSPAVAQKKYDSGATDKEIKIGHTNPYSGPASSYGVIGKCEEAYWKSVNERGGINGRMVKFVTMDDGYNPAKTVEVVRPQPGQAATSGTNDRSPMTWSSSCATVTSRVRSPPGSGVSDIRIVSPIPS